MNPTEFLDKMNQIEKRADSEGRQFVKLVLTALSGHDTPCPHDEGCTECDCHTSQTHQHVTVRSHLTTGQVCCVEWPVIPMDEASGRLVSTEWAIHQIRLSKDQGLQMGFVFRKDVLEKSVKEAFIASRAKSCDFYSES